MLRIEKKNGVHNIRARRVRETLLLYDVCYKSMYLLVKGEAQAAVSKTVCLAQSDRTRIVARFINLLQGLRIEIFRGKKNVKYSTRTRLLQQ